jgi:hypothetical protein
LIEPHEFFRLFCYRPSEDRLFTSGWKDDCYFYGGSNAYMTRPTSHELLWLRRAESSFRGAVPWHSDAMNQDPGDSIDESPSGSDVDNEEDSFLPRILPPCISTWTASSMDDLAPDRTFQLSCITSERMQAQLDILLMLFRECYQLRLFAGGLSSRAYDGTAKSLLPTTMVDAALFLDYLPLLRVMSTVHEGARDAAAAKSSTVDAPASRRRTRNSSHRAENRHFLSDLVPSSQFDDELGEESVPAIVNRLSKLALHRKSLASSYF